MISKQDCHILNSCHHDYTGHAVSPYDASSGVDYWVGHNGGVGFMWKNSLDECVTIVHCDYDWMCCIKISSANKDMYIINVYITNVRIITTCTWIICLKLLCLRRVLTVCLWPVL